MSRIRPLDLFIATCIGASVFVVTSVADGYKNAGCIEDSTQPCNEPCVMSEVECNFCEAILFHQRCDVDQQMWDGYTCCESHDDKGCGKMCDGECYSSGPTFLGQCRKVGSTSIGWCIKGTCFHIAP